MIRKFDMFSAHGADILLYHVIQFCFFVVVRLSEQNITYIRISDGPLTLMIISAQKRGSYSAVYNYRF